MPDEHQPTVEELKAKAYKPMEDAKVLHPFYRGKIETTLKCCVRDFQDFGIWYTPGVSAPCLEIKDDPEKVYEHTNKWNTVAVISDGTRVLGMGDIGPKAGMPVMEGKSLLYKYLGGVDGFPLMVGTKDPDEFIQFVKLVQPGLGGVNLEDIAQPKCFRILDTLRAECEIPVWHDDQQGTACVTLAGLINALKVTGKKIDEVKIAFIGSGAANVAISRLIFAYGARPELARVADSKGILHKGRSDIEAVKDEWVDKWKYCQITNEEQRQGGIAEALKDADVCIALSKQGPDTILPEQIRAMNPDPIVFLCSNPIPEMWPWDAKEAGAAVVATGRSDFENQVNNSLGFPGIFRGTLDVRAKTITDEMCIAAAEELAKVAEEQGLRADYIMPTMDDWVVFPREAAAVAMKAVEQGIALRTDITYEQEVAEATAIIARARGMVQDQMALGYIEMPKGSKAPMPTGRAVRAVGRGVTGAAKAGAQQAVGEARVRARELTTEARAEARKLLADAKAEARKIVADAKAEARKAGAGTRSQAAKTADGARAAAGKATDDARSAAAKAAEEARAAATKAATGVGKAAGEVSKKSKEAAKTAKAAAKEAAKQAKKARDNAKGKKKDKKGK
jgi:malate dehydrogenase (oxaloacetate-decarboxylating)